MQYERGVYKYGGYVRIRIWLGPKRNPDGTLNPPYQRSWGCICNQHIQEANNHVRETRDNFKKGIMPGNEPEPWPMPVGCDIYYKREWINNRHRSRRGVKNTGYAIERFKRFWRTRAGHTILPRDIELYVDWRRGLVDANGAPLKVRGVVIKENTITRELATLSAMFVKLNEWNERREIGPYLMPTNTHGHPYNPVEFVKRSPSAESKRERVASDQEMVLVITYCRRHDPDMLEIIIRAMITGLRQSDLEKVNGHADVRGILSKSREKKLFRFPLDFSRKLNYTNFRRRWDALRTACGMEDFHWHDWRHTSGTILYILGFTIRQIQLFYGHATEDQTWDYINLGKERLKPHVEALRGHMTNLLAKAPVPQLPAPVDPDVKVCRGCHAPKSRLTDFGKHSASPDGLNSRCRKCCYAATKAARLADPSLRQREYEARRQKPSAALAVNP
jgi:integrase